MKSENFVEKITKVMTMEYLNPFDVKLDPENLYNLSSGAPVEASLAEEILSVKQLGEDFVDKRVRKTTLKIHDPISRNETKLFKSAEKNVVLHHMYKNKEQVVEVNWDILGKLLAHSAKTQKAIDFKKALTYPLRPILLCFAHLDGTRRTTAKSKLMDEILTYCDEPVDPSSFQVPKDRFAASLVDLMALVGTLSGVCGTYKSLSYKLFSMIPKGYERIDIVADTYREQSLKNPERLKRGTSSRVRVQSALSKMPRNFEDFLKNGENKNGLIELIQDVLI